jgi:HK97 family phage major capsid protein
MTTTVIPTSAAELEEMLGDSTRMQELFADTAKFGEFITNYARAVHDRDQSIATQVREETQRVLAGFLRDNPQALVRPNLTPDATQPMSPAAKCAQYNRRAPGAKVDELFTTGGDGASLLSVAGQFLQATWHRARTPEAAAMQDKLHQIRNAFGSTVPSDGGFLIPESLRSELLRISLETAVVRPRARVIPMESLTVPFPTVDSTSNASNVYGGVTAYWTEEGGALVGSSAKFSRIKLEAKKLTAYSEVPNELFTDSLISLEAFINQAFPEAIAWFEDIAFMRGTGVGEPLGFLHASNTASISVTKESGQAADTIVWENIVKMFARMMPTALGRAIWVANLDTFPELATMALSVGTGGSAIWLNNGVEGPPMMILGRPVVFTEKAETLGDAGDINFVDLGYYLIGDRQVIQAETSPHYKFGNDQTAIRFIERVDGRPWVQSAITPNKGANTLSPFVKLAARA